MQRRRLDVPKKQSAGAPENPPAAFLADFLATPPAARKPDMVAVAGLLLKPPTGHCSDFASWRARHAASSCAVAVKTTRGWAVE